MTDYRDDEVAHWRSRAEAAEQRLREAASFYPVNPPEPPVGTTYTNPDGTVAWVRREDGWHCGRTEPCRNCPCDWDEAWEFGIRDPKLTRTLGGAS